MAPPSSAKQIPPPRPSRLLETPAIGKTHRRNPRVRNNWRRTDRRYPTVKVLDSVCKDALGRWRPALQEVRSELRAAGKVLLNELAIRASARICEECSGPLRWWGTGLSLPESRWMHQTCWDGRQFFRQYIAFQVASAQSSNGLDESHTNIGDQSLSSALRHVSARGSVPLVKARG